MKKHLDMMLRSMAWADEEVLRALQDAPAALEEAIPLLGHLLAAEHIWLCRITGREAIHPVWPQLDIAGCDGVARENASGYLGLIAGLREPDLEKPIHYRNTRNEEFTTRLIDILTHVVIHGAYHRGQIARILGATTGSAVNTDFITFARNVEPL
jgi:uncharacterized damage-inducible protein DinB